jgi:hypothetical protein
MSKRHQSSRRRAYGRRQHELHEREGRRHFPEPPESGQDDRGPSAATDPFNFMDPRTPRLRFSLGE